MKQGNFLKWKISRCTIVSTFAFKIQMLGSDHSTPLNIYVSSSVASEACLVEVHKPVTIYWKIFNLIQASVRVFQWPHCHRKDDESQNVIPTTLTLQVCSSQVQNHLMSSFPFKPWDHLLSRGWGQEVELDTQLYVTNSIPV